MSNLDSHCHGKLLEALKKGKGIAPFVHFPSRPCAGKDNVIQWTPGASPWEIQEALRIAARFNAPAMVHIRYQHTKGSSPEI